MLTIEIEEQDLFNDESQEFIKIKKQKIQLEHSLVSLSKWESKWEKPFLSTKEKTNEEIIDYIRCMTITQNVDPNVYLYLSKNNKDKISKYISANMTATKFFEAENKSGNNKQEIITAELIYYYMLRAQIPVEFQKWHLNRLTTLIKVCGIKDNPKQKMSKSELMNRNKQLNEARKKELNTKG